jgi:uncharacterized protein
MKQRILEDIKTAMRAKDSLKLTTLRMLSAAIKQVEIDDQTTLDATATLAVVQKMIKQRQDAASQFAAAGRQELADKEIAEIDILTHYMPEQLSDDELTQLIDSTLAELACSNMKDMGRAIGVLKGKIAGRADMGKVSAAVKAKLS